MGGEDDVPSAVACLILTGVAGHSLGRSSGNVGWIHPLVHVNLAVHGIIGILHYQNSVFGVDTAKIFPVSLAAARFLSLAGLNADLWRYKHQLVPVGFVLISLIPVYLEAVEQKNEQVAIGVAVVNLACIAYYASRVKTNWSYYTVLAAATGSLVAPLAKLKPLIPLGLAAFDYCVLKVFVVTIFNL